MRKSFLKDIITVFAQVCRKENRKIKVEKTINLVVDEHHHKFIEARNLKKKMILKFCLNKRILITEKLCNFVQEN